MKVFFYKNYFPQVAVTNFSLSAGARGSWGPAVLDDPDSNHLAGAMWNGFDIFRCQTASSRKLITDKVPVTAESSLDALYRMLDKCRGSLAAQLAALTLESDKGNGVEDKGNSGKGKGKGNGGTGKDKSEGTGNGGAGKGTGKDKDNVKTSAGKTRRALQPVPLSTLNILLQNLEQAGDNFIRDHFAAPPQHVYTV